MSGHEQHGAGIPEEDHSITVKVGIFFVLVLISLFVIGLIGS